DNPFFLEVSSVATQFTLGANAQASADISDNGPNIFGLGAGTSYSERPTVTYSPLQGDKFIQRVLSPVSLENIALLYHSGWSVERVFRLCLQRLGHLNNAPGASGPTPQYAPDYEAFARVARLLRSLQVRHALDLLYQPETATLLMRIAPESLDWPETRELFGLLKIDPGKTDHVLDTRPVSEGSGHVRVEARSLLGIMFYLSQSVEVPERDRKEGKVTVTTYRSGEPFEWSRMTGDLFRVRSQSEKPSDASAAVNYRGSWFFVDDSDLTSKSTFSLLSQIFFLQAGKIKSAAPLLTLPVGQ
ncbi:MAG: hypothetical protein ACE5G9_04815, partial [Nitrospinales bacterium]